MGRTIHPGATSRQDCPNSPGSARQRKTRRSRWAWNRPDTEAVGSCGACCRGAAEPEAGAGRAEACVHDSPPTGEPLAHRRLAAPQYAASGAQRGNRLRRQRWRHAGSQEPFSRGCQAAAGERHWGCSGGLGRGEAWGATAQQPGAPRGCILRWPPAGPAGAASCAPVPGW